MQQAAVNLATTQKVGEILAVNGPPGTGKTTLLRDVVAAQVTERARAMARFDDPEAAFLSSGQRLQLGQSWVTLSRLDGRIKGFEMLIASSNNKAVENVSGELPAAKAIAEDMPSLRYFKPLADQLQNQDCWGLVAAVLGNSGNRSSFRQTFWWDEGCGLLAYFKAITGKGRDDQVSSLVAELDPPLNHAEALRRWQQARDRFQRQEKRLADLIEQREELRRRLRYLPPLDRALRAVQDQALQRPGFFHRLFALKAYRQWQGEHLPLARDLSAATNSALEAGLIPPSLADMMRPSPWLGLGLSSRSRAQQAETAIVRLIATLAQDRQRADGTALDEDFFAQERPSVQTAAPWFTAEEHRLRDGLFEAALDLHRAFIDAAAKPLRHNLAAMMTVLDGKRIGVAAKDDLIPDLWSSLFLVVPAVSTTFASVGRMLAALPAQSLGWLLVDEAGQATPQQAIGALMRAKRAVVVGDPIQVPPVVPLPDQLTRAICRSFGVDSDRYAAPQASVQTLADDATSWCAEFPARIGSRIVGVPLLVHRRCAEPMFGIANRVAYENLMVHAKAAKASPIRDLLGPARWIDVAGAASDKWCLEEGRQVLSLVEQVVAAGLAPDLYMVTPFVQVAEGLRALLRGSALLKEAISGLDSWVYERVGTVHTVQGREAEAVIFVLGAPNADQTGARGWAGQEPNLLNVAVTRAKETVYVVGNRQLWRSAGVFNDLDRLLERFQARGA